MSNPLRTFLDHLNAKGVKWSGGNGGVRFPCTGHDGEKYSAIANTGDGGRLLLHCHSHNCTAEDICRGAGMEPRLMFPDSDRKKPREPLRKTEIDGKLVSVHPTREEAALAAAFGVQSMAKKAGWVFQKRKPDIEYDYHNSEERVSFVVCRWNTLGRSDGKSKEIRQIRQVDGGWICNAMKSSRPLYRLPDVIEASIVVVCEGEKAADKLRSIGFVATTPSQGANSPAKTDWSVLTGKSVTITVDNDDSGRQFGKLVIDLLPTTVLSVKVVELKDDWPELPIKGDAADWLEHFAEVDHFTLRNRFTALPDHFGTINAIVPKNRRTPQEPPESQSGGNTKSSTPSDDTPPDLTLLNHKTVFMDGDEAEEVPLCMADIVAQVRRITQNWPRVCDGRLFVSDAEVGVRFIDRSSQLTAYLSDGLHDPPNFKRSPGFISELVLFEHLHVCQTRYEAIEFAPHEPRFSNRYYACEDIQPGDGSALNWVLDRFEPATTLDGDLIKAFLATSIWGGDGGTRPCFVVTAPDRGAGKTTLVEITGELTGGVIDVGANDDPDKLKARLLSGEGRRRRIALIDNAKSRKLSSAELESMITCSTISGRANYVGEASRPNSLLWCVTMNGISLSRDMAQRSVIIKLALPQYSGTWKEDTLAYVREHRDAILGDLIAFLRGPKKELRRYSRWGSWERHVLSLLPEPSEAQKLIAERQGESDVDDEETSQIADHFSEHLRNLGYSVDSEVILIPSRVAAVWYAESIGSRDTSQSKASRDLGQKMESGMLKSLHPLRRKDLGRGFVWCMKPALPPFEQWKNNLGEKIEQLEILKRQEKRWH
jgi:hypothetical protein